MALNKKKKNLQISNERFFNTQYLKDNNQIFNQPFEYCEILFYSLNINFRGFRSFIQIMKFIAQQNVKITRETN